MVTAQDVPGDRYYGLIVPDWPGVIAEGEITHCTGSFIAAVVADDVRVAREAGELVDIEYEVLVQVTDHEVALRDDAAYIGRMGI